MDGGIRAEAIRHDQPEMGALGEVLVIAAEGAFDEVEGRLRSRDTGAKRLGLCAQDVPTFLGIGGSGQRADAQRARAEADRLFLALPMFVAAATRPR
ncbi:hypothetical protein ACFC0D_01685 [Streptomyces sp. NPDC056222]|uniref:hypothetical protein n=1 Tax=Streptomyces sp. NPDC056222 TaxID=3345749 RepID=UPI0035DCBB12